MQAQQIRNKTEAINHTQSLAAVQTLLRAGLGAIAYLRNLLPEDNFVSSHFITAKNESDQSFELESSQESSCMRRNGNGFSIMTLARGYTDEADRLMNYLEYGIFDALEKRYLRSFIFAVYLDSRDPNNILEAYTFNFKYYTLPDSDVTIPVMSLGDSLKKMTLTGKGRNREDPVARAIRNGKAPTLKEVKMSVKTLLKTLITAMQKMELLPRRRFATFKIFYTEDTPLDYEPPHFQTADVEKDKWYFMTHDLDEVPDRYSIGKLDTGHHGVNITVASITPYLPSPTEHDNEAFGGTVGRTTLTPLQEVNLSRKQAEVQIEDATKRNVVWAADGDIEVEVDAEGSPDYILGDGSHRSVDQSPMPIGIRGNEGVIKALLPMQAGLEEAQYGGISETVSTKLQEIAAELVDVRGKIAETQPLSATFDNRGCCPNSSQPGFVDGVSLDNSTGLSSLPQDEHMGSPESIYTPLKRNQAMDSDFGPSGEADVGMLNFETQPLKRSGSSIESIKSFGPGRLPESIQVATSPTAIDNEIDDEGLGCECGIHIDDDSFFCEGGCKKWFHVWCMGYHSVRDPRIPARFVCFDCRARSDVNWDFIQLDIYPEMLRRFRDLALFRRAIKVAEQMRSFGSSEFHKALAASATQMIKKLEEEEFILKETLLLDDTGANTTSRSRAKAKSTSTRPRRNLQKARYIFDFSVQSKDKYKDYFKPNDRVVESRILGINEMLKPETQTQEETQRMTEFHNGNTKRGLGSNEKVGRPLKKVKISVTAGVDLAE